MPQFVELFNLKKLTCITRDSTADYRWKCRSYLTVRLLPYDRDHFANGLVFVRTGGQSRDRANPLSAMLVQSAVQLFEAGSRSGNCSVSQCPISVDSQQCEHVQSVYAPYGAHRITRTRTVFLSGNW